VLVTALKPKRCAILRTSSQAPEEVALFWARRRPEENAQGVAIRAGKEWKIEKDADCPAELFEPRDVDLIPSYALLITPIPGRDYTPIVIRPRHNHAADSNASTITIEFDRDAYTVRPVFTDEAGGKRKK
jgi:hypothetical protein